MVLVHGLSRVVLSVLKAAMNTGKNFTVFVTEGRPEASGCHMAEQLLANGIPVSPFHVPVVSLRFGGPKAYVSYPDIPHSLVSTLVTRGAIAAPRLIIAASVMQCTLVLDSAAAFVMEGVDMVLMGAEGVVENGGIINKLGSFQVTQHASHAYMFCPAHSSASPPRKQSQGEARLVLQVSAAGVSPPSRCPWGGDALLLSPADSSVGLDRSPQ